MKSFIYKTKEGKEVMPFCTWVAETRPKEDQAIHDTCFTPEHEALLNEYFVEMKVDTVTVYEDDKLVSGPTKIDI